MSGCRPIQAPPRIFLKSSPSEGGAGDGVTRATEESTMRRFCLGNPGPTPEQCCDSGPWDNRRSPPFSLPTPPWHGPVRPSSTMRAFTLSDFDFDLPPELVAQHPATERTSSRLLDGTGSEPVDRIFKSLPSLLREIGRASCRERV